MVADDPRKTWAVVAVMGAVLLLPAGRAAAGVFAETYGFSAQGIGQANAMAPVADGWDAVFYNIAGLGKTPRLLGLTAPASLTADQPPGDGSRPPSPVAGLHGNQIAISLLYTYPQFDLEINRFDAQGSPLTTAATEDLNFGVLLIGATLNLRHLVQLPRALSTVRLGLGLGSILGGYAQKLNDIDQRTHNFLSYGREAQRLFAIAGLGLGFLDDTFGFGLGVSVTFGGQSQTMLSGTEVGPDEQTPFVQTVMDLKTLFKPVAGIYFRPGKVLRPLRGLDLGVAFRGESYVEIDPFLTRNQLKIGNATMDLRLALLDFYTPHIVAAGLAYDFSAVGLGAWTAVLEAQYERWSGYRVSSATQTVFDRLAEEFGPQYKLQRMRDLLVPKFGVAVHLTPWLTTLAGYSYRAAFVADNAIAGKINWLDNPKHIPSCGLSLLLPKTSVIKGQLTLTASFQAQILAQREVTKTTPDSYNPNYTFGGWNPTTTFELSLRN